MNLAGCEGPQTHPDPARDPVATIAAIFAEAVPGNPYGAPFRENEIVSVSATAIDWRPLASQGVVRSLRFADVDAIEFHVESELPSRPEAIFIYLRGGGEAAGATRPPLEGIGLARPTLVLRRRAAGSVRRLREALAALGFAPGTF